MHDLWWMITAMAVLILISIFDIRKKQIPWWGLAAVLVLSAAYIICEKEYGIADIALSLAPGVFFILIAVLTEGKMGIGDGLLISALGLGLGVERCVYMVTFALLINCLTAIILLVMHKVRRSTQLPFVPFITVGMGVMACVCG